MKSDLKTIRVLLVASDPDMADTIRLHLGQAFLIELVDVANTAEGAREKISLLYPDVVLLAQSTPSHPLSIDIYTLCREFNFDYPGIAVVLLLRESDRGTFEAAMDAGARGIIEVKWGTDGWYVIGEQLESRIRQAYDLASRQRGPQWPMEDVFERRRSVALVSGKGGVGKSLLAALLALKSVSSTTKLEPTPSVALLDMDFQRGVQHVLFDVEPRHTFADIAQLKQGLDRMSLRAFSHEYRFAMEDGEESRLYLVASPSGYNGSRDLTTDDVTNVLSVARNTFDFVIVDTSVAVSDMFWPVIQTCSYVWFVCTPDVLSVYTTRRSIDDILSNTEGDVRRKLGIVINRASTLYQVSHEDVHSIFESENIPIIADIPSAYETVEPFVNQGDLVPLIENSDGEKKELDISTGINNMMEAFMEGVVTPSTKEAD